MRLLYFTDEDEDSQDDDIDVDKNRAGIRRRCDFVAIEGSKNRRLVEVEHVLDAATLEAPRGRRSGTIANTMASKSASDMSRLSAKTSSVSDSREVIAFLCAYALVCLYVFLSLCVSLRVSACL